jgi:hypothetical protein
MNKILSVVIVSLILLSSISLVSATITPIPEVIPTKITGFVYQNNNISDIVSGASVDVSCLHDGSETKLNSISNNKGVYKVEFNGNVCTYGDVLDFYATNGVKYGSRTVTLGETCDEKDESCLEPNSSGTTNIAMVDLPLVPEFGVFAGALTLLSAVGIFFFVRKR